MNRKCSGCGNTDDSMFSGVYTKMGMGYVLGVICHICKKHRLPKSDKEKIWAAFSFLHYRSYDIAQAVRTFINTKKPPNLEHIEKMLKEMDTLCIVMSGVNDKKLVTKNIPAED